MFPTLESIRSEIFETGCCASAISHFGRIANILNLLSQNGVQPLDSDVLQIEQTKKSSISSHSDKSLSPGVTEYVTTLYGFPTYPV